MFIAVKSYRSHKLPVHIFLPLEGPYFRKIIRETNGTFLFRCNRIFDILQGFLQLGGARKPKGFEVELVVEPIVVKKLIGRERREGR